MHEGMGIWMAFAGIWWLAIIGLIVYVATRFSRNTEGDTPRQSETALDIAARRFARGEIAKEEFERIRTTLARREQS